jgi:hypothetical protein
MIKLQVSVIGNVVRWVVPGKNYIARAASIHLKPLRAVTIRTPRLIIICIVLTVLERNKLISSTLFVSARVGAYVWIRETEAGGARRY